MTSKNIAVIVTGAASGIGLAMTMGLMKAGHDVVAVDRNTDALAELSKQGAGLKGSVHTVTADLAQPDSFAHVTGAALIKFGRIDALVNNAGIGQASVRNDRQPIRFWETTAEQWGRFIAINAAGPINMARAVLPTCWRRSTDGSLRSPPASEQWCEKGSCSTVRPRRRRSRPWRCWRRILPAAV